jgi:BASS family bile acid:Na+ symporter
MTLVAIVVIALKISIVLVVFALGLKSEPGALGYLLARPGQLAKSLLAMNLLMPPLAAVLVSVLPVPRPVGVMLVALSLSPVPPILPGRQIKAGGNEPYAISLMFFAALFAVVSAPLWIEVMERVFGVPLDLPAGPVAKIVLMTVLAPLVAGAVVRMILPRLAARIAEPISKVAMAALLAGALAIVATAWRAMFAEASLAAMAALVAFTAAGVLIGHLLGGPGAGSRRVLALSTATRHPGMALTIAAANFADKKAFVGALLLYMIAGLVVTTLYLRMRGEVGSSHHHPGAPATA